MPGLPPLVIGGDADLADAASSVVRGYVGWHIAPAITEDVVVDGPSGQLLMLPSLFVTSVNSVTEDTVVVDATDYDWSANGYVHRTTCTCWTSSLRGVTVNLTHGYDECPSDVAQVVLGLMAVGTGTGRGQLRQAGPFVYDTTTVAASVVTLSAADKATLDRYRIPGRL